MTDTTPIKRVCNFTAAGSYSSRGCGKDAVLAARTSQWRNNKQQIVHAPRCKFHASIDRNRKWSAPEIVEIDDAIRAEWAEWDVIETKRRAEERARMNEAHERRVAAARVRAAEDAAKVYVTERVQTEEPQFDGTTVTKVKYLVHAEGERDRWGTAEVQIVHEDGQFQIRSTNSSHLMPNQAKALAQALLAAVEEIS